MKKNNSISIEKFSKLALSKKQLNNVRGGEDSSGNDNFPGFPTAPPDPRKK